MKMIFRIESGRLEIRASTLSFSIRASSGKGGCCNNASRSCQKAPFEGPIPVGNYYLRGGDLNDPGIFGDLTRNALADWGDWRIRVYPSTGTDTYGRNNFFMHGGSVRGTSGCIDIGGGLTGSEETHLLRTLLKQNSYISLEVRP